jgi:hypothetical protein
MFFTYVFYLILLTLKHFLGKIYFSSHEFHENVLPTLFYSRKYVWFELQNIRVLNDAALQEGTYSFALVSKTIEFL